jgi:hypothetical protein
MDRTWMLSRVYSTRHRLKEEFVRGVTNFVDVAHELVSIKFTFVQIITNFFMVVFVFVQITISTHFYFSLCKIDIFLQG